MRFRGPGRGRGPDSGNGVIMSAGRGAVLVAVAVIVGLLVLAVVDDGGSGSTSTTPPVTEAPIGTTATVPATNPDGSPAATATTAAGTTATTKAKKSTSTTAKSSNKEAKPNDQVVVQVLNGSGIQNAATTRTNDLKARGYQTAPAGNAPAQRTGTGVQCKAGYDKEAAQLVTELQAIGVSAVVEPIANPLPSQFDPTANCYVILGK
jgi:hypothetical protein